MDVPVAAYSEDGGLTTDGGGQKADDG